MLCVCFELCQSGVVIFDRNVYITSLVRVIHTFFFSLLR